MIRVGTRDRVTNASTSLDRRPEPNTCETVEGPYLSNDAWIISAKYYVFKIGDGLEWQPPRAGERGTSAPDLYPCPTWDKRDVTSA